MKSLNPSYASNRGASSDGQRYVFQTFAARVASVNLDEVHRRSDLLDLREDGTTYAASTLERWVELNSTAQFKEFRAQLAPLLLTVPLILHRRSQIFDVIRAHLAEAPVLAIRPMLEVTAALAVDLRQEFYPEFPALLSCMAALLKPSDLELLEAVFTTICLLFQYLLRQLLADLPTVLAWYRDLLSHPKPHVRDFAAESFAYLLRQTPLSSLPSTLRATVVPHAGSQGAALDSGIARLFFHACRGQSNRLHSRTPAFLGALLESLPGPAGACTLQSTDEGQGGLQRVLREALALLCEHTRQQHASPVWEPLAGAFGKALRVWRRRLMQHPAEGEGLAGGVDGADDGESEEEASAAEGSEAEDAEEGRSQAEGARVEAGAELDASEEETRAARAAGRLRLVSQLLRQWAEARKGSRVPEGAAAAALQLLQQQLTPAVLRAAAGRGHLGTVHELLQLLPALLCARSSPLAQAAVLARSQAMLPALLGVAASAIPGATDGGSGELGVLLLRGGLALLDSGWRSFGGVALPSVLDACEALAATHPSAVRAALLRLAAVPELRLPPGGRCVQLLCDSLAPAPPDGAGADAAFASSWLRTAWTAASILCRVDLGSIGAAPQLPGLLEAALPHPAAHGGDGHIQGAAKAATTAAVIEAQTALAARKEALSGDTAPLAVAARALQLLRCRLERAPSAAHATATSAGAGSCGVTEAAAGPDPQPAPALLQACALAVRGVCVPGAPPPPPPPSIGPLLPLLLPYLSHPSAPVRVGSLQLLAELHALRWLSAARGGASEAAGGGGGLPGKRRKAGSPAAAEATSPSASAADVALERALRLGLQVEASPSAPNSKQLVLDFEELSGLLKAGRLPAVGVEALCHFAIGALRIRFARVWPLTRQMLLELTRSHAHVLWPQWLSRLQEATNTCAVAWRAARQESDVEAAASVMGPGHKELAAPDGGSESSAAGAPLVADLEQRWARATSAAPPGTTDSHFASQLLSVAAQQPLLRVVLQHSAELMPLWRECYAQSSSGGARGATYEEVAALESETDAAQDQADDAGAGEGDDGEGGQSGASRQEGRAGSATDAGAAEQTSQGKVAQPSRRSVQRDERAAGSSSRAEAREQLQAWLRLFAAVEAPSTLHEAARLHDECATLLGHAEPAVQALALDCLVRWGEPALLAHEGTLRKLIADATFRETLSLFVLDVDASPTLSAEERPLVLPLLSRLLFSKLTQRSGRGASKNSLASRRATIFSFFGGYTSTELASVVALLLAPLAAVGGSEPTASGAPDASRARALCTVDGSKQLGMLRALHDAVSQIGGALAPYARTPAPTARRAPSPTAILLATDTCQPS